MNHTLKFFDFSLTDWKPCYDTRTKEETESIVRSRAALQGAKTKRLKNKLKI